MKVKVAETAGFCFGVKRAVDKVYELIDTEQKPIFTLGPIIHNEGVVADLEARGVHVITEADLDFPDDTLQNGTVVIRSHGVGKAIYDKLKEKKHLLCRCDLPLRSENPQDCGKRKPCRKPHHHHRRQRPPRSTGHLRMVPGSLHGDRKQRRSRSICTPKRQKNKYCVPDDI